jgi:hypothetical protein
MATNQVTELLCGQDGIFTQLKSIQDKVMDATMLGKNLIDAVENTITEVQTFIQVFQDSPETIVSILQQTALNLITQEALANPQGIVADILALRAAYESAGPAIQRVIDNLEQFVNDPLNVPLDVCNDIPNLVKIGETFIEFPKKALQPDPTAVPSDIKLAMITEYEKIFDNPTTTSEELLKTQPEQTIPTAAKFPVPDVGNDIVIGGIIPSTIAYDPKPGNAHQAALLQASRASRPASVTAPAPQTNVTQPVNSTVPPPSLANPFPEGTQFTVADFAPSKFAKSIATRVNSLHPAVRGRFAAGVQDYIKTNYPIRDINVTEGYRSPERSGALAASGIKAAPAGKSWHNYGSAADVAIYVEGKYDDGRRGPTEYTGLARASMEKYGLANDLSGDSGHFYPRSFGQGVPKTVQSKQVDIFAYASQKGLSNVAVASAAPQTGATEVYNVRGIQRAARDKAIKDALDSGKSIAQAEAAGEVAGNRAGADALKTIKV